VRVGHVIIFPGNSCNSGEKMFEEPLNGDPANSQPIHQKEYTKPELVRLGDIRGVTLGGSLFPVESGITGHREPKAPPKSKNPNIFTVY
jgi:hypothetical protein